MNPDWIIFPCLFIALYFEAFLLVTFLSAPARAGRARVPGIATPAVAMIVPCHNEETTIGKTVDSLLALDYPAEKLSLVLVNDGSTDRTREVMSAYEGNPRITVIHQAQGGKHAALNTGIAAASNADIVGCLDADSFADPAALREMIPCFERSEVAAATAAMSVANPRTLVEKMQNAEYILGIALRHILASINGLYVTPGPFSLYRRSVIEEQGGFRHGYQTEDMEMALRLQKAGYVIENAPRARVYTTAPASVPALIRQRTRWTSGFLRNTLYEYRSLIGNPRHPALGFLVLPMGLFAIFTAIALFALGIFESARQLVEFMLVANGVPLSHLFVIRPFELFYLPFTVVIVLTLVILATVIALTFMGKRLSGTPGPLGMGMLLHTFAYGFIAPLWVMQAVADVSLGSRRVWKHSV